MPSKYSKYRALSNNRKFKTWLKWAGLQRLPHQINANLWCESREMALEHPGGILADEMGLGKTIVMLGRIFTHPVRRTLVVVPRTLLSQWDSVIKRWILALPLKWLAKKDYLVYHGLKSPSVKELAEKRIVLTTYGTLSSRIEMLEALEWDRAIYDEAHHLREMNTNVFKAALRMRAMTRMNWLMTGTPIQNSEYDLYALCEMLGFEREFYTDADGMEEIIANTLLRRTKKSTGLSLPPVTEHTDFVEWSSEAEEELAAAIHGSMPFLSPHFAGNTLDAEPLALLTRARQVCICPHAIRDSIQEDPRRDFLSGMMVKWKEVGSSKIDAIMVKLLERRRNDNRKIVFCHYRSEIDELLKRLTEAGITAAVIDGRTPQKERETRLTANFSKEDWDGIFPLLNAHLHSTSLPIYDQVMGFLGKTEVLLLQIQTACEGLNLQDFNEVYFTSPHWNPAVEDQAVARCHRKGQRKAVEVFRFIMAGLADASYTIDEYSRFVQLNKRKVFKQYFD